VRYLVVDVQEHRSIAGVENGVRVLGEVDRQNGALEQLMSGVVARDHEMHFGFVHRIHRRHKQERVLTEQEAVAVRHQHLRRSGEVVCTNTTQRTTHMQTHIVRHSCF
jgi:hypothetical protein